jgi:hypothetical protein
VQAGIIGRDRPSSPNAQTPDTTPAPRSISQPPTGSRSRPAAADVEGGLERANIQLSTGTADDIARVRVVKATNEIHGTAASSFDEIVEASR